MIKHRWCFLDTRPAYVLEQPLTIPKEVNVHFGEASLEKRLKMASHSLAINPETFLFGNGFSVRGPMNKKEIAVLALRDGCRGALGPWAVLQILPPEPPNRPLARSEP